MYVPGLVSGLNTTQVINALMQSVEQPQIDLQNEQSQINSNVSDYQQINSDFSTLQSAAEALASPSAWQAVQASSSDPSVATASASGSGSPSSISFSVEQLAQANTLASTGTVASTADVVGTGNFLVSAGGGALGLSTLTAGSTLGLGSHSVDVTQALTGAEASGGKQLQSSTVIASSNDSLAVTIDGTAYTFTLQAGTYTPQELAQAVAAASGGLLVAQVGPDGQLEVSTTQLGSSATLAVTGGSALSSLGMSAMSQASSGTNGSVTVDGTATSLTSGTVGGQVSLPSGSGGSITATLGAFGSTGSLSADNVSLGNGSLSSVVSAINGAGLGVSAEAVQSGSSSYRLQLSSTKSGSAASLSVDTAAFSSTIGNLTTVAQGQDAMLQVGGSGGYTVSSASNTVNGLLPGLSVTVSQVSSQPVTASLSPDATGLASKVKALVDAANAALADINKYAGYNASTKQGGPLMGDPTLTALTQEVLGAVGGALGGSNGSGGSLSAADAGLSLTSNGTLSFNSSTFESAFSSNPSAVAALFGEGGSFTPSSSAYAGGVSFNYANDNTAPGTYAVSISHSATQATDLGSASFASGAALAAGETVTVSSGATSASYTTQSGDTLQSVAQSLNAAFAKSGVGVTAQVVTGSSGQQLELQSATYGSAASFNVSTSGGSQFGLTTSGASYSGTDVVGTIDGKAATGQGQVLSAPQSDPALAGLSLMITASGITSATNLGNFTYTPGIAGSLAGVGYGAADPTTGSISTTIQNLQGQSQGLGTQIAAYDPIISAAQQSYQNEFAQMEAQLATLKNESNWLSSQLGQSSSSSSSPIP